MKEDVILIGVLLYFVVGGVVDIYVSYQGRREDPLFPINLIGSFAAMSGFFHIIFIVLWPVWLIMAVLSKKS